ncbi:uncharacterized protein LOC127753312 [Oryza glaberrima]|uniref:uncharacterized protein LOC127753312 n=1 Tax=Oryza glaberrima TaxID=4538 RepID=UPI00224C269F|nr:uncharacterized protein LOC127753312 [Oryza glaberrima]
MVAVDDHRTFAIYALSNLPSDDDELVNHEFPYLFLGPLRIHGLVHDQVLLNAGNVLVHMCCHRDKQRTPSCLLCCVSLKFEVSFSNSFKAWRTKLRSMGRSIGCSTNCRAKLQHRWWPVGCSSKLHSCSLGVERLEILEESDQRVADLLEDQKG